MTLYELNKQVIGQCKPYDPIQLHNKVDEIFQDIHIHKVTKNKYMMFLCRELYDFTVLVAQYETRQYYDELKSLFTSRGEVLMIEKQDNGAYEVWIRSCRDNQVYCYYLFNCNDMMIEVG
jgi:hypothetical protein